MLNVFNSTPRQEYKTAYLKDKGGETKTYFKYYRMKNQDIEKIDILSGIFGQETSFIIRTTSQLNFTTDKLIYIDGIRYVINRIPIEFDAKDNGYFVKNYARVKYISLKG